MTVFELCCLPIVALYVVTRARLDDRPSTFLRRLVLLSGAAWLGESTCISLYGYYAYEPAPWSLWLGQVPLFIPLIWPSVVVSADDIARHVAPRARLPVAATLVLLDASLMEPIAVRAGLWRWSADGLFEVPVIGIFGWSFFALACLALFQALDRSRSPALMDTAVLFVGPAFTHLALVATWWLFFKWSAGPLSEVAAVVALWLLSSGTTLWVSRKRLRAQIPAPLLWTRVPPALFFFGLLAVYGRDNGVLVAYALAFAPPYIALTPWPPKSQI